MKILFIRRKKNQPEKPEQPKPEINILALPKSLIAKGVLVRVTEEGAEILEPEGAVLERLGLPVTVLYDPDARRYNEPPRPWVVRSKLEYTYKGQCFGIDAPKLVKSIGLEFPNAATPWAYGVEVEEEGALAWHCSGRPDAKEIAQVIEEAQRQVEGIMKRYGETKEILAALDKGAK